jgi:hypothetical protein
MKFMTPMHFYLIFWGMFLIALSIWLIKRRVTIMRTGGRAQGHIIGHKERVGADSTHFSPMFAFVDHNGVQRHIVSDAESNTPHPKIGAIVDIRYHQQNPEQAFIYSFYPFWFGQLVLIGFAAALFFFAWYPNSCLNHPDNDTCRWDSFSEL